MFMSKWFNWRALWTLFTQAVVVFTAAVFVFSVYRRDLPAASYNLAVSRAIPAVVSIEGQDDAGAGNSIGSGVIISEDGHILTNYHLIANAGAIEINLREQRAPYVAKIVGVDPEIDIAVLRIDAEELPAVAAAAADAARPGDVVFAIGNPFGLDQSATMGIVSAVGRDRLGLHDYERFIQTDAAINPGSSGGALANAAGELVGINSALFYRRRGVSPQGIGFAVPADLAMRSYERLTSTRPPTGNKWGAEVRVMPERLRREIFGAGGSNGGVLISRVWADSPAAKTGMRVGDIILRIDNTPAEETIKNGNLPQKMRRMTLVRNGDEVTLKFGGNSKEN